MDKKEFGQLVKKLREAGLDDDKILHVFVTAFEEGEMGIEDLELLFHWLGYELKEEFYKDHNIKIKKQNSKK